MPFAVNDLMGRGNLNMSSTDIGGALSTYDKTYGEDGEEMKVIFSYPIFAISMDEINSNLGVSAPEYIKIDVDGIENKIIKKSEKILKSTSLNSVLIEINANREEDKEILEIMKFHGFNYDINQVKKSTRLTGRHKGYAEYIFKR